jgi:predicted metal-dependent HD superfamily phosphohydrolase
MTDQALGNWLTTLPHEWTRGVQRSTIDRAYAAYQSPGRHYHNWDHVTACVEQLRSIACEHPRIVFLALLFHDAVYVPGRTDNEERSALLAREVLGASESYTQTDLGTIEQLILATKDHHAHMSTANADEAALLDIDLSILAAPRDGYMRYAGQIRDEWVPPVVTAAEFRVGRIAFLRRMLGTPNVYLTADARQRWDDAARANMTWELCELQGAQRA